MIKSVHLTNFRSYEDATIDCVPGINGIWGSSRAGKSNILRALRWVVFNRPSGDGFRSRFAKDKDTIVRVTFTDDRWVERVKGSVNAYRHGGPNIELQEFKAMGLKVPEEIAALLNMSEVNIQAQMDQPFMVSMGAPELAKHLNQYANLSVIDRSMSFWRKKIQQNNARKVSITAQLDSNTVALEQFERIEELDGRVSQAEAAEKAILSKRNKAQRLRGLVASITIQSNEVNRNKRLVEDAQTVLMQVISLEKVVKEKSKKADRLHSIITSIEQGAKVTKQLDMVLKKGQAGLTVIEKRFNTLHKKQETHQRLSFLIDGIEKQQGRVESLKKKKETLSSEYQKAIPKQCPVCLQSWPTEKGSHRD